MLNPLQLACLTHFGCGHDLTCTQAKQLRPKIMQQLLCEVQKPGGEITKIGGITKSRADWIKALESLLEFTYRICELAAESEGPFAMHCHPHVCGEDLACPPRRHYGRRMW
jgi:hypothetical protein